MGVYTIIFSFVEYVERRDVLYDFHDVPVYRPRGGDERPPTAASKIPFPRTGDKRFGGWSC